MRLLVMFVLLSLLVACGPSEETINATVESRVQIAVSQTVAAIPSQTPYPTPSPYPTPTPMPLPTVNPIPDDFRNQVSEFLRASNAVTGATSQGVSYIELRRLVNEARGAYDLSIAMWPKDVDDALLAEFEKAFNGWDLTLYLWNARIEEADEPVEPNINRYREFIVYSDSLILETHPSNFIVRDYRDKQYVSFDNVEVLMAIAADHFFAGQEQLLSLLR